MKPVAALVAITLSLLAGPLTGAAVAGPTPVAPSQVLPPVGGPLRLDLAQFGPRIVTAGGPDVLTLTGTLTNTGNQPVEDIEVRVQRGDPLTTEGQLRDALEGSANTDAVTPEFIPLAGELAPGGQVPIQLRVPLRGAPETGLALADTGVHQLLVNVNGVPREGPRARLAEARMLLPVLSLPVLSLPPVSLPPMSLPPDPLTPEHTEPDREAVGAPFTMLYPVADTPRRLSTVPGEQTLLTDDALAASFAPGGRLDGLVGALTEAAPVGSPVRNSTCLAVDADLVATAAGMRSGYLVIGPDGVPVPGAGAEAAGRWLDRLVATARGGCVTALPFADADLVALNRGGAGDLAVDAVVDGRQVLADILQTPIVPGVTWPADGVLDELTLHRTAEADGRSLLLSADGVDQNRTRRNTGVLPIAGARASQFAVLTDPLLTLAAAGPAQGGPDAGGAGADPAGAPAGTVVPLSTQDVIGALAFRAREAGPDRPAGPLVLAPPHRWAADATGARALFGAVDQLLDAELLVPRALDAVLAAGPSQGTDARPLVYPLAAGGQEVPSTVVDTIGATSADVVDLRSAAVDGSGVGVSPDEVFAPLRRGLVRPASAAWRGRPDAAADAAAAGAARIDALRASVRVLEPPSPYSLGTASAPILLTVANGLPVTVEVRVEIASSSGLRVAPIEPQSVPPLGRRQVEVSTEVLRSGRFTVQASVRTPDGGLLGPPSRLHVRSTAYGTITVWLTGIAGVLLVVLVARRVLRRVRGEPGRHSGPGGPVPRPDPDFPGPRPPPTGTAARPHPRPQEPAAVPRARPNADPFPDPLAVTDRRPPVRPRDDNPRRPPGPPPPRVPNP